MKIKTRKVKARDLDEHPRFPGGPPADRVEKTDDQVVVEWNGPDGRPNRGVAFAPDAELELEDE